VSRAGPQWGRPPKLFQPFDLVAGVGGITLFVFFLPREGSGREQWKNWSPNELELSRYAAQISREREQPVECALEIPLRSLDEPLAREPTLSRLTREHLAQLEDSMLLSRLGDLEGPSLLEPALRRFLADHPNPDRTVFVMTRFAETQQQIEIASAIREALARAGYDAVRADDRAYIDELWSNIQVYITGSRVGVAVFEEIERNQFNPHIALELGYMLAARRRCLMLKEQRLERPPTDVIGRLYGSFDMFNISATVGEQVSRWARVDLSAD
jgi:hypothetical protein